VPGTGDVIERSRRKNWARASRERTVAEHRKSLAVPLTSSHSLDDSDVGQPNTTQSTPWMFRFFQSDPWSALTFHLCRSRQRRKSLRDLVVQLLPPCAQHTVYRPDQFLGTS